MYQHCPWSIEPMINVMWAVSPFTEANGATRVAVGSHFWDQDRQATEEDLSIAEMSPGSCLLYLGSTLHGAGANMTDVRRTGIIMGYCLGWLRQYENQYLAVPPEAASQLSKELAGLIGYAAHRPHLGLYECRDPLEFLTDGLPENLPADDVPDAEMAAIVAQVLAERQATEAGVAEDDQQAA
jgi:ectoine hydroxylase-related dioxygenase (phytanoyl-CoA dioxygenase family)